MNPVYILTGAVHSGKTTKLMKWAVTQSNIDGIYQPVIEGKRFIYHIGTRALKPLETGEEENITPIGKFKFSNITFEWSRQILKSCLSKKPDWIIIDEIGPLELAGKGLEPAFTEVIESKGKISSRILCVVREDILDKFIEKYQLQSCYEIFESEDEGKDENRNRNGKE
ncbi:MAG: nucleoside-triphosphatase [Melioribacteraceae bacterium]